MALEIRTRWMIALAVVVACSGGGEGTAPVPVIDEISPESGNFREAAVVRIRGSGFGADARVRFGSVDAVVDARASDELTVTAPATGHTARVVVSVETAGGVATAPQPYVFHAMAPEALAFVDDGAAADGPVDRAFVVDVDRDDRLDLVLVAGGASRWLKGGASFAFAAPVPIDGEVLGAARFAGRTKATLLVRSAAGLELVAQDGEAFTRTPVPGLEQVLAVAVQESSGGDTVVAVGGPSGARVLAEVHGDATTGPAFLLEAFEPASVEVGDGNGDGALDVLLGGPADGPRLLVGDGHGALADAPAEAFGAHAAGRARFVDLDADGSLDVVVAASGGDRALVRVGGRWLDRTDATIGLRATGTAGYPDLDGDGAADRVTTAFRVYRNDGTGRLFDYTAQAATGVRGLRPLVVVDLDADGDPDVVAADAAGRVHVAENWAPRAFLDPDHDGVPTGRDVCPAVADPAQADRDRFPFGCASDADCRAQTGCGLVVPNDAHTWLLCTGGKSFADAQAFCRSRGAKLLSPRSAEEARAFGAALGEAWVGLSDRATEGAFVDDAGGTPTYTGWRPGEPNDAGGNEDCAATGGDGSWNDLPCGDRAIPFGCEDAPSRTPDGFGDACDVCPLVSDPDQADANGNHVGDACEAAP